MVQPGWTALVLACINGVGKREFSLNEVYACEAVLQAAYLMNPDAGISKDVWSIRT